MDLGLAGKKVIISAATRGVGRVTARTFLEEGASVEICGRRPGGGQDFNAGAQGEGQPLGQDGVAEAVEYLSKFAQAGQSVNGTVVDCGDEAAVRDWVAEAGKRMGGIDVAVSNASALGGKPATREGWDINYNVDMMSSVAIFESAYPFFKTAGGGAFVQTGSVSALEDHPFGESFSYSAIKAGLINYVHQLAHKYMAEGIRCNTVCPGPTEIADGSWGFLKDAMPDYYADNLARHPAGRFGRPEEIANAIVFIASEKASWIMGENLTVDGGYTTHVKY